MIKSTLPLIHCDQTQAYIEDDSLIEHVYIDGYCVYAMEHDKDSHTIINISSKKLAVELAVINYNCFGVNSGLCMG